MKIFSRLIRTITLSKVAIWTTTLFLSIVFLTAYEKRNNILEFFASTEIENLIGITFDISSQTKSQLSQIVINEEQIIGISVNSADLRLNESKSLYFYGDSAVINSVYDSILKNASDRVPMFTNLDSSNNDIIGLINGQFKCSKFEDTVLAQIRPQLFPEVSHVCRSSIPSYYGYFSGFISVYISGPINEQQILRLRLITDKLSNDIYFRDVLTSLRSEKPISKPGPND